MPDHGFPRSTPNAQDVDPRGVIAFLDAIEQDGLELHSLMIVRHGHVVTEGWWTPYSADRRHLMYSVTKTFTATATAFAVGEGLLSLEDRVVSFFPDDLPDAVDPRVAELTIRHLLTMSTGHDEDTLPPLRFVPVEGWIRTFLSIPPQTTVGSRHIYNNGCSLLLGYIVQSVTGEHLLDYLRPRLFERLGIDDPGWTTDSLGREQGWSGLHLTTQDVAALGDLYLHDGVWQGERLLPSGWVAAASSAQIGTEYQDTADWRLGYGYQLWVSRHGYRADGAFGQFGLVLPEQDAVIVTTAGLPNTQEILDRVWSHLLPALSATALSPDPEAERALVDRLAALHIAPLTNDAVADATWTTSGAVTIAPVIDEPDPWYPALSDVELVRRTGAWTLTFREAGEPRSVACGDGPWIDSTLVCGRRARVAVSATAGAHLGGAAAEVIFLETPHRLRFDLTADAGIVTASMQWNVAPLHAVGLADLQA